MPGLVQSGAVQGLVQGLVPGLVQNSAVQGLVQGLLLMLAQALEMLREISLSPEMSLEMPLSPVSARCRGRAGGTPRRAPRS
jgi:hypothetical protein